MPTYNINYTLLSIGRENIRGEIIELFKKESPGTGTGNLTSKYIYTVELFQKYKIIIKRPALFNKGFDFLVLVETSENDKIFLSKSGLKAQKNPTHDNIVDALASARNSNYKNYDILIRPIISLLYKGEPFNHNKALLPFGFKDHNGIIHPIEIILLAIKWLFIEQDITYWNWSGRKMLYDALVAKNLA